MRRRDPFPIEDSPFDKAMNGLLIVFFIVLLSILVVVAVWTLSQILSGHAQPILSHCTVLVRSTPTPCEAVSSPVWSYP